MPQSGLSVKKTHMLISRKWGASWREHQMAGTNLRVYWKGALPRGATCQTEKVDLSWSPVRRGFEETRHGVGGWRYAGPGLLIEGGKQRHLISVWVTATSHTVSRTKDFYLLCSTLFQPFTTVWSLTTYDCVSWAVPHFAIIPVG